VVIICYKTILLPVVVYEYETWPPTTIEGHRLWGFENRALRRTHGPMRGNNKWTEKLHEELDDMYSLSRIVCVIKLSKMRWRGHVACTGKMRNVCKIVIRKSKGKIPTGRP
jgi:hypothetical protein